MVAKIHRFGRFKIEYDPEKVLPVILYDETEEIINCWNDLYSARMDIDYSPVGEEITLEQWQEFWDWVEDIM
jgi:hypothetical protein